jgi:hypothetical protein
MPVLSSLALRALARSLRAPVGGFALRRLYASLLEAEVAPTTIERIAARRPARGLPDDASGISFTHQSASHGPGPLAGERVSATPSSSRAWSPPARACSARV